ncbi:MAG: DUF2330 domain-containing protein [Candidatus Paceibacterota bacterium]
MIKKLIISLFIITLLSSPFCANGDGYAHRRLPNGDLVLADENNQEAFINYQNGQEKLVVVVDIDEQNSDTVWIMPIPGKAKEIKMNIMSEIPVFGGYEVMSKIKLALSRSLKNLFFISATSQFWSFFPVVVVGTSLTSARGGSGTGSTSGDFISVNQHIEKNGMIMETITAQKTESLYNYLSNKGLKVKQGDMTTLSSYMNQDYVFVVSWLSSKNLNNDDKQRGIFIAFPTQKIYYPLIPTSIYGEKQVPMTIRIFGHVKPEIFSEIKPYTKVEYFLDMQTDYLDRWCRSSIYRLKSSLELYHGNYNSFPSSLEDLSNDPNNGSDAKNFIKDMEKYCLSPFLFHGDKDNYEIAIMSGAGRAWVFDRLENDQEKNVNDTIFTPSKELNEFYENKNVNYTKITINAPAQSLKKDLWMKEGSPLKISLMLHISNWLDNSKTSLVFNIFLYIFLTFILSFLAGGIIGLIYYRNFIKYALIGLSNIFTLLGFYLFLRWDAKGKPKTSVTFSFSLVFLCLFAALSFWSIASLFILGIIPVWFLSRHYL